MNKLEKAFRAAFPENSGYSEDLKMEDVKGWDSVGHLNFVLEVEDAFNIRIKEDDIKRINSVEKMKIILLSYGISDK